MNTLTRTIAATTVAGLALAGCSATDETERSAAPQGSDALIVSAAFYPLEYIASQVGGDNIEVRTITQPGVDPHDAELSPAAVRELRESDVILYIHEFQPAVDDAVAQMEDVTLINVEDHIDFRVAEAHAHGDGEDQHFWLDPNIYAQLAPVLADTFGELDADNAEDYQARATATEEDLLALDQEFSTTLASCERDVIVVGHEAFGYLTDAYGLEQVGMAGLSPDAEPSPARIREVREIADHEGVTTIYFETLVDSAVSETFANDLDLATAVLDPIEGLVNDEDDYRSVMARNLDALAEGLGCN
ncbi:MAG: metal ABC transporter substrate-binding protein [Demequina sp.]